MPAFAVDRSGFVAVAAAAVGWIVDVADGSVGAASFAGGCLPDLDFKLMTDFKFIYYQI